MFVHGAGGGQACWALQERRFEGGAFVALPGHPAGEAMGSVGAYAEWLAVALDEVPPPRALVGHGLGAAVALTVAGERPDAVDGLILTGIGPALPVPDDALARAREDFPAECERVVRASFASAEGRSAERTLQTMVAAGPRTLAADYAASRAWDPSGRLGDVRQPVLVVAGSADALTPPSAAEALARELPSAIMSVVPGAGHRVMMERAAALNLLVAGYLARLELTLDDGD